MSIKSSTILMGILFTVVFIASQKTPVQATMVMGNTQPKQVMEIDDLNLIRQLEASTLKSQILTTRDICFSDSADEDAFKNCYEEEVAKLITEKCVTIRQTEAISESDCENFLHKIVMNPDSIFPNSDESSQIKYRMVMGNTQPKQVMEIDDLNLIRQLEASTLKSQILTTRDICFSDSANEDTFKNCYEEEVAKLITEKCVTIRQTKAISESDCENFLHKIVMNPDAMFPSSG